MMKEKKKTLMKIRKKLFLDKIKNIQKSFFTFIILSLISSLNIHGFQDKRFILSLNNKEENSLAEFNFNENSKVEEIEVRKKNKDLVQSLFNSHINDFINPALLKKDELNNYITNLESSTINYPRFWNSLNIYIINSALDSVRKYIHCHQEDNSKLQVIFVKPSLDFLVHSKQYEITSKFYEDCTFSFNQEQSFLFQFIISSKGNFLILNRSSLEKQVFLIEKDKIEMEIQILQNQKSVR